MESKAESTKEEGKSRKNVDPLTFILWGILLTVFGVYAIYSSYINPMVAEKMIAIGPYTIVTVFGVMVSLKGYRAFRDEKAEKQKK